MTECMKPVSFGNLDVKGFHQRPESALALHVWVPQRAVPCSEQQPRVVQSPRLEDPAQVFYACQRQIYDTDTVGRSRITKLPAPGTLPHDKQPALQVQVDVVHR